MVMIYIKKLCITVCAPSTDSGYIFLGIPHRIRTFGEAQKGIFVSAILVYSKLEKSWHEDN